MITLKELLAGNKQTDLTGIQLNNLEVLLERINKVRVAWNQPMIITSGFRSHKKHAEIYEKQGIPDNEIPWGSCHLIAMAVDIADTDGSLGAWLKANPKVLEDAYLWCEAGTVGWIHFQSKPPASGSRWFRP